MSQLICSDRIPDLGVTKLQKLLYYAQAWHLTWTGEPLFDEQLEAWPMGPVVAEVWRDIRDENPFPPIEKPNSDQLLTIDYVLQRYGSLSGSELIERTHSESPWIDANANQQTKVIPTDALVTYFSDDPDSIKHRLAVERIETDIGGSLLDRPADRPELRALRERVIAGNSGSRPTAP